MDKVSAEKIGYGMDMADIVTKQNLPALMKSAVEQELAKLGFQIGSGTVAVNLEITKFYNDFKMGLF